MKRYVGKKVDVGPVTVMVEVVQDGKVLRTYALRHVVRHSPDEFQWGYAGSGPADLARSILIDLVGKDEADGHYQDFKAAFIAPVKGDLSIDESSVRTWLEERKDYQRYLAGRSDPRD